MWPKRHTARKQTNEYIGIPSYVLTGQWTHTGIVYRANYLGLTFKKIRQNMTITLTD